MGRMSELAAEIEELYEQGLSIQAIATELDIPLDLVQATLYDYDESIFDSMDGDEASGLASAGWGTDEDYGGDCDML
jgi:DNA-directed RNA polymerase specialized sigma24 family protein